MLLRRHLTCLCCLLFISFGYSQFDGIILNEAEAYNGYVLVEKGGEGTYLIDNCGQIVHSWPNHSDAAYHPKLLPNGNLLFLTRTTGRIVEVDWDGNEVNNIALSDPSIRLTYEVILLPNQNYLCVGRQSMSPDDFAAVGYELPGSNPSQGDVVVEVNRNTGEIEWLWRIFDHVIQDRDMADPNYGFVVDNPQLLDMGRISLFDWEFTESFMINGMDYNPTLDQIALSVRKMCEVVIIDHSTTTSEAAGSTGGNAGKGGDILYRYGNPQNYDRGNSDDQVLFYQHNPKWILHGAHAGKLTCYNNGLNNHKVDFNDLYSSIPIFEPMLDSNGDYAINALDPFMPLEPEVAYDRLNLGPDFYSGYTSGGQVLPNGNIYITVGGTGQFLELDKTTGALVWEYRLGPGSSGFLFRTEKYAPEYAAFDGKNLFQLGMTIEEPSSTVACQITTPVLELDVAIDAHFNMATKVLTIEMEDYKNLSFRIYKLTGEQVLSRSASHRNNLPDLQSGLYVLQFFKGPEILKTQKILIL